MKRPQKGSTIKQYAYATRRLSGQGNSKKEIALLSGYTQSMAENAKAKIEDTEGYQNAVIQLATESNNLLMAVMAEFKVRGLSDFSNKDLNAALNAISGAWDRIEKTRAPNQMKTPQGNPLRAVFTERTRTVEIGLAKEAATANEPTPTPVPEGDVREAEIVEDDPMDF